MPGDLRFGFLVLHLSSLVLSGPWVPHERRGCPVRCCSHGQENPNLFSQARACTKMWGVLSKAPSHMPLYCSHVPEPRGAQLTAVMGRYPVTPCGYAYLLANPAPSYFTHNNIHGAVPARGGFLPSRWLSSDTPGHPQVLSSGATVHKLLWPWPPAGFPGSVSSLIIFLVFVCA